ncbi:hypothetical protein ACFS3C_13725 [Azotobacter vinelandii]
MSNKKAHGGRRHGDHRRGYHGEYDDVRPVVEFRHRTTGDLVQVGEQAQSRFHGDRRGDQEPAQDRQDIADQQAQEDIRGPGAQRHESGADDELGRRDVLGGVHPREMGPAMKFVLRNRQLLFAHAGDVRGVYFCIHFDASADFLVQGIPKKILAQDELAPMRVCFSRASNLWRGLSRTRDISPLWLPVIHGWSESGLCRGFPREKCNGKKSRHAWAERGFHCYSLLADRAIGHLVFIVTLHREWTYSTGKPGKRNYTGHSPPRQIHNYRKSVLFARTATGSDRPLMPGVQSR